MRGFLLDTNIVSELKKPTINSHVKAFIAAQPLNNLFISDITFAELIYGVEQITDPIRRADYHVWIERDLRPLFFDRSLCINEAVIVRWKEMVLAGQKRGHTFGQPDLFIAAIAALADLIVVSRDTSQYIAASIPVFDPWNNMLYVNGISKMVGETAGIETMNVLIKQCK
jgi:toxin FitB